MAFNLMNPYHLANMYARQRSLEDDEWRRQLAEKQLQHQMDMDLRNQKMREDQAALDEEAKIIGVNRARQASMHLPSMDRNVVPQQGFKNINTHSTEPISYAEWEQNRPAALRRYSEQSGIPVEQLHQGLMQSGQLMTSMANQAMRTAPAMAHAARHAGAQDPGVLEDKYKEEKLQRAKDEVFGISEREKFMHDEKVRQEGMERKDAQTRLEGQARVKEAEIESMTQNLESIDRQIDSIYRRRQAQLNRYARSEMKEQMSEEEWQGYEDQISRLEERRRQIQGARQSALKKFSSIFKTPEEKAKTIKEIEKLSSEIKHDGSPEDKDNLRKIAEKGMIPYGKLKADYDKEMARLKKISPEGSSSEYITGEPVQSIEGYRDRIRRKVASRLEKKKERLGKDTKLSSSTPTEEEGAFKEEAVLQNAQFRNDKSAYDYEIVKQLAAEKGLPIDYVWRTYLRRLKRLRGA